MQLKYRAYIDGEFYYFDLLKLVWIAQIQTYADDYPICKKIIDWLEQGNQPDVFTGYQDKNKIDIYSNDIIEDTHFFTGERPSLQLVKYQESGFYVSYDTLCAHIVNCNWDIEIIGTTHQNKDLLK
jgi:hypothetical protein